MRAAWVAALALLAGAAVPSPAVALSLTWLCFFDHGSTELSPRCQARVIEFVAWWQRLRRVERGDSLDGSLAPGGVTQVVVHGHTDASEAVAGRASVGRARGEAVAAFLRLNGVPAEAIRISSFGARVPLSTGPRTEAQNRRVELIAK